MDAGSVSPSQATSSNEARLRETVAAYAGKGFAIIDGAHFDDVIACFRREGLFARSLFLDHADAEVEKAGPWLVKLDQYPEATDRLMTMVGDKPAAVYWSCAAGEMPLWRHLRTINLVRIPAWAAAGEHAPPIDELGGAYTSVMFRHWDPSVLGSLLPALDAEQFARLTGPAQEIVFMAPDFGGLRRVVVDQHWPKPQAGQLTIRSDQVAVLIGRRLDASHRRVRVYLQEVFPEVASKVPEQELDDFIRRADRAGRSVGLRSEAAHMRWAYLLMASNGEIGRLPKAMHFIRNSGADPDDQVRILIDRIATHVRRGA